jgi:hypothetical protein
MKGTELRTMVVPPSWGFAPVSVRVTLRFTQLINFNNAGLIYTNVRYNPCYVYDMDPTIGGTATPGFQEWGGLYRFARLKQSKINVTFCNKEAFPVTCVVCPNNFDPGANSSAYANYSSSRFASVSALGPLTGQGIASLTNLQTTEGFGGSRGELIRLDSYSFPTAGGTAPANSWFWYVGCQGASVFVNGVYAQVSIDVEVDFFELTSPSA